MIKMPSKKRFEYYSVPNRSIGKMNMYELAKNDYDMIIQLFRLIEKPKKPDYVAFIDVTNKGTTHYFLWKKDEDTFIVYEPEQDIKQELAPFEFYAWIFAKIPYVTSMGQGYTKKLEINEETT